MPLNMGLPPAQFIETEQQARELLRYVMKLEYTGLDTETTGLDNIRDYVVLWSLSDGKNRWCIDAKFLDLFEPYFEREDDTKILTNAKFDKHMLANVGIDLRGTLWDTVVMGWLLDVNKPHDLKSDVTKIYKLLPPDAMPSFAKTFLTDPETGKKRNMKAGETVGDIILSFLYGSDDKREIAIDYASKDAWGSYEVAWKHKARLEKMPFGEDWSGWDHYVDIEIPFTYVLWRCERRGITVDAGQLYDMAPGFQERINRMERSFAKAAGHVVNLRSPQQLREIFYFYDEKKDEWLDPWWKPCKYWTPGGKKGVRMPSTAKVALEKWADQGLEEAQLMLDHRSISKLYDTYIQKLPGILDNEMRCHTTLNQAGTGTGRLSSSDPNLQNIPIRTEEGAKIREAFVAGEGKRLLVYDYCMAAGTEISTPTGPIPIEDIRVGDLVHSYDHVAEKPRVRPVERTAATGQKETLVVVLDNGERVRCTPDHRWIGLEGQEILAEDLAVGQRLLPLRKGAAGPMRYTTLYSHSSFHYTYEHRAVAEATLGPKPADHHTHHKDEDPTNNTPTNLEYLPYPEHLSQHASKATKRQWQDPAIRKKMVAGIRKSIKQRGGYRGRKNPNYGNQKGEPQICPQCGVTFYRPPCRQAKFCSRKCYFKSKNHTVVEVIKDGLVVPTYNIRVKDDHNYALTAGVFVHNCQLEMRILAHLANDRGMIDAINGGLDIHCDSAARCYNRRYEDVYNAKQTPDEERTELQKALVRERGLAKNAGFLIVYGGGPGKLSVTAGIPVGQAKQVIEGFKNARPGINSFTKEMISSAYKHRYVQTLAGRYRHLPYIDSRQDRGHSKRAAVNTPIQGSAADIVKAPMIKLDAIEDPRFRETAQKLQDYDCQMLMQIHDELIFEIPDDDDVEAEVSPIIREAMEHPFREPLSVPLPVDGGSGYTWAEAK